MRRIVPVVVVLLLSLVVGTAPSWADSTRLCNNDCGITTDNDTTVNHNTTNNIDNSVENTTTNNTTNNTTNDTTSCVSSGGNNNTLNCT